MGTVSYTLLDVYKRQTEGSTLHNPENPVYDVKDGSVDFDQVSFKYSQAAERMALADIDLHIRSGETIGIIGGTGSSKSSLVQLISRLYDATEGRVRVGGVDVKDYDLETLRNQVAMVLQKNVLFSGTIKENLRWGSESATDEELVHACKLAQADEFVSQFPDGYDTYIEQGGTNVSGGQKQRLCIARALLKKPKILILDDSTSAVDTKTDALIRKAMREFIPETTKIIIAQRTASVEDADRIIVMEGGRINGIGTHRELMENNEIYREIYTSQNKACLLYTSIIAAGAYQYFYENRIRIPDEISVVGYENLPISCLLCPPLTSVDWHKDRMSEEACNIMLKRLEKSGGEQLGIVIPCNIVERSSVRKIE